MRFIPDRNVRINGLQSASSLKYNFTIFTRNSRNLAYPKVVATDEINNNVYNAPVYTSIMWFTTVTTCKYVISNHIILFHRHDTPSFVCCRIAT